MKKIKKRLFEIIQVAANNDLASRIFDICIICLIFLNVILVIAETFTLPEFARKWISYIETASVIVFTVEYILRFWTSDLLYPGKNKVVARLKYSFSFIAIIDLLAILPVYIPYVIPIDLRVLRVLRTIRLFRIFKITRYTTALNVIGDVFRRKKNQLISSIFVVVLLMIIASVLMYNIEHEAQPEAFSNALSALWWSVATLTTVGYGDIYPITAMGKVLSAVIALLGIGLVAVPTGIISSGFMENIHRDHAKDDGEEEEEITYCPHCGKKIK